MDNDSERLEDLIARFAALGASDPEMWAASEIHENIPQLARFCFLRSLWPRLIDSWAQDVSWAQRLSDSQEGPFADAWAGLARVRDAGVKPETLAPIARWIAYETVFGLLYHLGYGMDEDAGETFPGWRLMETHGSDGPLTSRVVDGLHEDLLGFDPSGR